MEPLTSAEAAFLAHVRRAGPAGYPILKVRRGWIWDELCGALGVDRLPHPPLPGPQAVALRLRAFRSRQSNSEVGAKIILTLPATVQYN